MKDPVWLEVLSHISTVITTLFLIEIPLQGTLLIANFTPRARIALIKICFCRTKSVGVWSAIFQPLARSVLFR